MFLQEPILQIVASHTRFLNASHFDNSTTYIACYTLSSRRIFQTFEAMYCKLLENPSKCNMKNVLRIWSANKSFLHSSVSQKKRKNAGQPQRSTAQCGRALIKNLIIYQEHPVKYTRRFVGLLVCLSGLKQLENVMLVMKI